MLFRVSLSFCFSALLYFCVSVFFCLCRQYDIQVHPNNPMRVILLLLMLMLSPLAVAEWRQLTESDDGDVHMVSYYEPGSLIRSRKPKISIMVIFSKSAPQFSWRATKYLWEANCFSKQIRLLGSVEFTHMGRETIPPIEDPYTEWMPPDDVNGKIHVYNLLCRGS
jgi:hypothetical protein